MNYLKLSMKNHLHKMQVACTCCIMNHNIGRSRLLSVFCLVFQGIQESGFLQAE